MVEICGTKYVEGKSKRTGKFFQAYVVYFTEDGAPHGVNGFVTGDAFIALDLLQGVVPRVGDKVELLYNKYGFLSSVRFVG